MLLQVGKLKATTQTTCVFIVRPALLLLKTRVNFPRSQACRLLLTPRGMPRTISALLLACIRKFAE